jgi:hypothetical protein
MTVDTENIQYVVRNVKCPHCHYVAQYRIAVQGTSIALKSLFNSCVMSLLFLTFGLVLSVTGGWKVVGLAILAVVVVMITDYLLAMGSFGFLRVVLPRLIGRRRLKGEITARQFTVVLNCANNKCPNPDKSFEATLWLPIEYGSDNSFSVHSIQIVG